ncbi:hypothetical protein GCM10009754_86690 [Amycolatopsis minnesotensis]|uniref:Uncharacterized protein n=1 Tax=Amycolatopsis minnesotensis TaxID=337894 RepID=A0ABP5E9F7_9PSEU
MGWDSQLAPPSLVSVLVLRKGTFRGVNAAEVAFTGPLCSGEHALKVPLRESDAAEGPFGA